MSSILDIRFVMPQPVEMNIQSLEFIMKIHNLNQSELARCCGVTRQAVSLWFSQAKENPFINIQSKHLAELAKYLNIPIKSFFTPPFQELNNLSSRKINSLEAKLNWDHLFLDLEDFFTQLKQANPRAIARLVQSYGVLNARNLIGDQVLSDFPLYKKYLIPIKRKQLEKLWKNLTLHGILSQKNPSPNN